MSAQIKMVFAGVLLAGFFTVGRAAVSPTNAAVKIQITSPAFSDGQPIPEKYIWEGQNVSPALQWSGAPSAAKSLALICDDPDAPMGTWVHWVIYDLPATTAHLAEGVAKSPELPDGAKQGMNSFKKIGYGGPWPPPGKPHHYHFKIYALDTMTGLKSGATKADLLKAMKGHVLAQGQLIGTYQEK